MLKHIAFASIAAGVASAAAGQSQTRPDPADPKAAGIVRPAYESTFKDYRRYSDPEVSRWREANEEVGKLDGHKGHVQPPRGADSSPRAAKPAAGGHGSHR